MNKGYPSRKVGLARALSKLGYCSRSRACELIACGRVTLNGAVRRNPEAPVRLERDRIDVDRKRIAQHANIYLLLNKPRGLVTTRSDEKGRDTVYSCLPSGLPWVAPVGRLDKASEGLLLFTNDSEWAARVLDPATHLERTYHAQIRACVDDTLAASLTNGFADAEGEILRATRAKILRPGERNTWLEIILDEGKNRHIRRLFEHVGIEVLRLVRIGIGPLELGDLCSGATRLLRPDEKRRIDAAMQLSVSKRQR